MFRIEVGGVGQDEPIAAWVWAGYQQMVSNCFMHRLCSWVLFICFLPFHYSYYYFTLLQLLKSLPQPMGFTFF